MLALISSNDCRAGGGF